MGACDEWALLSMDVMEEFAYLIRAIERGDDWLKGCLHAHSVFLAKTDTPSLDPIDYRRLFIFPLLNRKWAFVPQFSPMD